MINIVSNQVPDLPQAPWISERWLLFPAGAGDVHPGLGEKIDVLMNNAGVMAIPQRQETKDEMIWMLMGMCINAQRQ